MMDKFSRLFVIILALQCNVIEAKANKVGVDFDLLDDEKTINTPKKVKIRTYEEHLHEAKLEILFLKNTAPNDLEKLLKDCDKYHEMAILDNFHQAIENGLPKDKWNSYLNVFRDHMSNHLKSISWEVRYRIIWMLGHYGDGDDLKYVLDVLQLACEIKEVAEKMKKNKRIIRNAETLIGEIDICAIRPLLDNSQAKALAVLKNRWYDTASFSEYHKQLSLLLGKHGFESAKNTIIRLLLHDTDPKRRSYCASLLSHYKPTDDVVAALKKALNDEFVTTDAGHGIKMRPLYRVRMSALVALKKLGVLVDESNITVQIK